MKNILTDIIIGYEESLKEYMLPVQRDKLRSKAVRDILKIVTKIKTRDLLENIVKANTDHVIGTVDYDGVAEDVLSELRRYQLMEEKL